MIEIVVLVVAVAVLGYVLAPLRRPLSERSSGLRPADVESLLTQRDALYRTLRDLEFDRELGNVDEEDYRELSERYRHRAAHVLRELDAAAAAEADEIERAVSALRARSERGSEARGGAAYADPVERAQLEAERGSEGSGGAAYAAEPSRPAEGTL